MEFNRLPPRLRQTLDDRVNPRQSLGCLRRLVGPQGRSAEDASGGNKSIWEATVASMGDTPALTPLGARQVPSLTEHVGIHPWHQRTSGVHTTQPRSPAFQQAEDALLTELLPVPHPRPHRQSRFLHDLAQGLLYRSIGRPRVEVADPLSDRRGHRGETQRPSDVGAVVGHPRCPERTPDPPAPNRGTDPRRAGNPIRRGARVIEVPPRLEPALAAAQGSRPSRLPPMVPALRHRVGHPSSPPTAPGRHGRFRLRKQPPRACVRRARTAQARGQCTPCAASQRSASSAALQPMPAAVTACR